VNTAARLSPEPKPIENDSDRLRNAASRESMGVELVSASAGDRKLTAAESSVIRKHKESGGDVFYSDLIYTISHRSFPPEHAAPLWEKILTHKRLISRRLGRNPEITVAALDYLSNIRTDLQIVTLISEVDLSELANLAMRDGMTGLFNHSSSYELLALYTAKGRGKNQIVLGQPRAPGGAATRGTRELSPAPPPSRTSESENRAPARSQQEEPCKKRLGLCLRVASGVVQKSSPLSEALRRRWRRRAPSAGSSPPASARTSICRDTRTSKATERLTTSNAAAPRIMTNLSASHH